MYETFKCSFFLSYEFDESDESDECESGRFFFFFSLWPVARVHVVCTGGVHSRSGWLCHMMPGNKVRLMKIERESETPMSVNWLKEWTKIGL